MKNKTKFERVYFTNANKHAHAQYADTVVFIHSFHSYSFNDKKG